MNDGGVGRVVVCRVGTKRFTVPVAAIREVVVTPTIVPIPGVPSVIRGMVNVRGALVTVVGGAGLMEVPGDGAGEILLVLAMHEGRVAIDVDDVEDLHTTESAGRLPALDIDGAVRPLFKPGATKP